MVAPKSNKDWLRRQQESLKQNKASQVLRALEPHLEPLGQEERPVGSAHGYITDRQPYMDYAGALATGLPIGSGEVEGGHRYVLQRRLKIAGAWWLERSAEWMLQLRTVRANGDWDNYWTEIAKN